MQPDKDVWVIVGDGGFQMTAAELSTIQQEKLHINIAVINNGFLGMVRQWQEAFYDKNYASSPILSPNFVKLADAHGIPGAHVTTRADVLPDRHPRTLRIGKPYLIDFRSGERRRRVPHDRARRCPARDGSPSEPATRNQRGITRYVAHLHCTRG